VFGHPKGDCPRGAGSRREPPPDWRRKEVNAPQILDKVLGDLRPLGLVPREYVRGASAGDEAEDKRWFALKPMNCPSHVQILKHGLKSYRDLPWLAEFGVVHRHEPGRDARADACGFTQDDAHVFCTEAQPAEECLGRSTI
jgi:threonyl-tRNA synthetase